MQQARLIPYTIEVPANSDYPFNLPKNTKFDVSVKVTVDFTQPKEQFHKKISRLININCSEIINIKEIHESYTQQNYTFLYEYVPFSVTHRSETIQTYVKEKKYEKSIKRLFSKLVENGIRPNFKLQDFGFTQNCELKFYLRPQYRMLDLTLPEEIKIGLVNDLLQKCQEEFEKVSLIEPLRIQKQLRIKIQHLQDKIKKIKNNFIRVKEKEGNNKSSRRQSSQSSQQNKKPPSNEVKANSGLSLEETERNFDESYSYRQPKKVKRRTSSFKLLQKKAKSQHKMSWQGSQTLPQQDSDKATVLKNRISQALMKTQLTLTKYEKVKKRGKSLKKKN